jgi:hypothetical protein
MRTPAGFPRCIAIALFAIALLPSLAFSVITPVSQLREVVTFAKIQLNPEGDLIESAEDSTTQDPGAYVRTAHCKLAQAGSHVSVIADQDSDISAAGVTASLGFSADAGLQAPAVFAFGIGTSNGTFVFDTDTPTECRIQGTYLAAESGVIDILLHVPNSTHIYQRQYSNTQTSVDDRVQIPAGRYEFTFGAGGDCVAQQGGSQGGHATATLQLSFLSSAGVGEPLASQARIFVSPNPVRDSARLSIRGPVSAGGSEQVDVAILDAGGRLVRNLRSSHGEAVTWDTRDGGGAPLPAGVYFLKIGDRPAGRATLLR